METEVSYAMTIFGRSGRTYQTFFTCVVSDPWKLRLVVSSVVGSSLPGVFQTSIAKSPHCMTRKRGKPCSVHVFHVRTTQRRPTDPHPGSRVWTGRCLGEEDARWMLDAGCNAGQNPSLNRTTAVLRLRHAKTSNFACFEYITQDA